MKYLSLVCLVLGTAGGARGADELATARSQLCALQEESAPPADAVRELIATLKPDGSWPDIDYANGNRGRWFPYQHLSHVKEMALAWHAPRHPLHGDPALGRATHLALDWWLAHDLQNSNWWYNEIGVPMVLGAILLELGPDVTPAERARAAPILARSTMGMTGQNAVWRAGNTFVRALLSGDAALARQARDRIAAGAVVSEGEEGVQPDASFHQHGPQQQFGNYGLAFACDLATWGEAWRGTAFALEPERIEVVRRYLLSGMNWIVWNGAMDISSCGRQLFPASSRHGRSSGPAAAAGAQAAKGRTGAEAFAGMARVDPAHAAQYQAFIDRNAGRANPSNALDGARFFWRSDYLVVRRPGFLASVKMSSPRVIGSETCNSENLLGYHLGDGAAYVYRTGAEYADIFPVWDWRRLPGTTCYANDRRPLVPASRKVQSADAFVGGVSDGRCAIAAMRYARDGIAARKAWFALDDALVCLGADIRADGEFEVATTLNQCLRNGEAVVGVAQGAAPFPGGVRRMEGIRWICHDGVGYYFPAPAAVELSLGPQTGDWKRVAGAYSDAPVVKEIFRLGISHGVRPAGTAYAYALLPGAMPKTLAARADRPGFRIVANTAAWQAVETEGLTLHVRHEPGRFELRPGVAAEVSRPCALLARSSGKDLELSVADPTQHETTLEIEMAGRYEGSGTTFDSASGRTRVTIRLPGGGMAGSTACVKLHGM